jgi:hypothetical protein
MNLLVLGRRVGAASPSGSMNEQIVPGESVRAKRALSMSRQERGDRIRGLLTHRAGKLVRYGRCNRGVFDLGLR